MRSARPRKAVLAACLFVVLAPAGTASKDANPAARFLSESYSLVDQFGESEKPRFLQALSAAAADVGDGRTEEWCKGLFEMSSDIREGWNRVAAEKNSLVQLSRVNPVLAMELLPKVEDPQPDDEGNFPEDSRAFGATEIISNYWKSPRIGAAGLPTIRLEAKRLAENGEYPYLAMAFVITQLFHLGQTDQANDIFREATEFFRLEPTKFQNRNKVFEFFLERTKESVADHELFVHALNVFADRVSSDISSSAFDFLAEMRTPNGTVYFRDPEDLNLFRAFGMISAADPVLARSLLRSHPYLGKYSDKGNTYISHGFVHGSVTREQSARLHDSMYQTALLGVVKALAVRDPEAAKELVTKSLSGDSRRILGLSLLVPGMMSSDPQTARQIYYDQLSRQQEVTDKLESLRMRASLAHGAACVGDDANLSTLSFNSLDVGMRLVEEDSRQRPDLPIDQLHGFTEVNDMVSFGATHRLQDIVDLTLRMPQGRLKAYLMITLAESTKQAASPCSSPAL